MLRVLTVIAVVVGVLFLGYAFLDMTGAKDALVARMEEKAPEKTEASNEAPKDETTEEAKHSEAQTEDAPKEEDVAQADAPPKNDAAEGTAADSGGAEPAADIGTDEAADGGEAKPAQDADQAAASSEGGAEVDAAGNPAKTAEAAEKGTLTSPYQGDYAKVAEEGHKKYMAAGCNGCHGGGGGGGMGPPLTNEVWVYGNDGDTLFRLIALGSSGLQDQGYTRKGSENVVGPMPPHGNIVKSNDDMWKIIGWIWSVNPPDKS